MIKVESRIVVDAEGDVLLIPDAVAFGDDREVVIERVGDVLTIRPWEPSEGPEPADRS